jgi:hypothetical protein
MDTDGARPFLTAITSRNFISAADRLHVCLSKLGTRIQDQLGSQSPRQQVRKCLRSDREERANLDVMQGVQKMGAVVHALDPRSGR